MPIFLVIVTNLISFELVALPLPVLPGGWRRVDAEEGTVRRFRSLHRLQEEGQLLVLLTLTFLEKTKFAVVEINQSHFSLNFKIPGGLGNSGLKVKPLQPRRSSSAEERPSKGATLQTVGILAAAYGGKKILAALSGRILGAKCADWENAKKNIKVNPLHNAQEINYSRGFCDLC